MLLREIEDKLIAWKNKPKRKALCIFGARQIGKTTTIRDFAQKHYKYLCEINFVESPRAKEIFNGDLDANSIIAGISAYTMMKLEPSETLIFFDEIQECPNARTAIKFLIEDGRYDYILSSSMLGISINDISSLPLGFEEEYKMHPMSFKEFAIANGIQESTIKYLYDCFINKEPVLQSIHSTLMRLFYTYIVVGGMPEAVQIFVDTHDIAKVIEYQKLILNKYRLDISKYSSVFDKEKIKNIYDSIPSQLNQKNKRFRVNSVDKNARLLRYQDSFNWLIDANVALPCYNVSAPILPLALNSKRNLFKLFLSDIGLLCASSLENIQFDLLQGNVNINMGSILENVIAQELVNNQLDLYYYDNVKLGEVDFVVNLNNEVTLLEVKSGNDYFNHNALLNVLSVKEWNINKTYVLCKDNIQLKDNIIYLPWYMVMFIKNKEITKLIHNVEINNIE